MPGQAFALTYDYRCPFARIAAEHVVSGLRAGSAWTVDWIPFSLSQAHVGEGEVPVWDRPGTDSGLLALQVGVAVRDLHPERFLDVHRDLFDVRHVHAKALNDPDVLGALLREHGIGPEPIWEAICDGGPLDTVRKGHERAVIEHDVWGVPTFIAGDRAAFIRLMAPSESPEAAHAAIERILDLLIGWPELNELKHTTLDR